MHEAEKTVAASATVTAPARPIFFFGRSGCEGDPHRREILGGKGASLAAMCQAGLPVPPGFTISIECCKFYHASGGKWPAGLEDELKRYMARLETETGQKFGQGGRPLLVSVRSGAARSMPGMMDTILNCGLHPALEKEMPDRRQFWTVYAQFVKQFGNTVAGVPHEAFEAVEQKLAGGDGAKGDGQKHPDRSADQMATLARAYIALYERESKRQFPLTAWDELRECINAVFGSWNNERANIYRKAHNMEHLQGTAVNVQSMFNSEVSGIGFTANPSNPLADEIIIESAYGLGEAVVSGDVEPDRFVLDRRTLAVKERHIGNKAHMFTSLDGGDGPGGAKAFDPLAPSLTDAQIDELAHLAVKVEEYFGYPVDIEWGINRGRFSLLQSRAVRGLDVARDVEVGRIEEINRLKAIVAREVAAKGALAPKPGEVTKVWIVHNLSETLEAPTPLSWDVMRGFMSGLGGFGQMYRDFGYEPSRRVRETGFLELICGRIFVDPDRAAELFWEGMPLEYDHQEILADPRVLESAPMKFNADGLDSTFLVKLPKSLLAMFRSSRVMKRARREVLTNFEQVILPAYRDYVDQQRRQDLTKLSTPDLVAALHDRIDRVLTQFGKESLKPGFFGGCARAELEQKLMQLLGENQGQQLCRLLTSGLSGDSTVEQNFMLYHVSRGQQTLDKFVELYGHRAVGEMELAEPRWREDRSYLEQIVTAQKAATGGVSPEELHKTNEKKRLDAMKALPETLAEWGGSFMLEDLTALAMEAQALLPYRETGKHYLLMGYELIRAAVQELAGRWELDQDIFFLQLDELANYEDNIEHLKKLAAQRRVRWQSAQKLDLPDTINFAEIDQLGLPRQVAAAAEMKATSLSAGVFTGTARIVHRPNEAKDLGSDCVLVCPSTDPSWTALFITIKGLIVERGGVLSHGAITARDFSIPAVACPDATVIIKNGDKVRVDGDRGHITIIKD